MTCARSDRDGAATAGCDQADARYEARRVPGACDVPAYGEIQVQIRGDRVVFRSLDQCDLLDGRRRSRQYYLERAGRWRFSTICDVRSCASRKRGCNGSENDRSGHRFQRSTRHAIFQSRRPQRVAKGLLPNNLSRNLCALLHCPARSRYGHAASLVDRLRSQVLVAAMWLATHSGRRDSRYGWRRASGVELADAALDRVTLSQVSESKTGGRPPVLPRRLVAGS